MTELMTAAEARKLINDMLDATSLALKLHAKTKIEEAVKAGRVEVSLNIDYTHVPRVQQWLEGLGYAIDSGSGRDGDWFNVRWQ